MQVLVLFGNNKGLKIESMVWILHPFGIDIYSQNVKHSYVPRNSRKSCATVLKDSFDFSIQVAVSQRPSCRWQWDLRIISTKVSTLSTEC